MSRAGGEKEPIFCRCITEAAFSVGGDAGQEWKMKTHVGRITKMTVYYEDWINGMDITYIRCGREEIERCGGAEGKSTNIIFGQEEDIISISGKLRQTPEGLTVIKQFTIVTSKDRAVTFGPPDNEPNEFYLRAAKITDFFGRAECAIYAIGVHFKPLNK